MVNFEKLTWQRNKERYEAGRSLAGVTIMGMAIAIMMMASGCIKNDLPYPRLIQNIIGISAKGEIQPATIDSVKYTATLYLGEEVDIQSVEITDFSITPGATADPDIMGKTIDLSQPYTVTLSKYQDYRWSIIGEQNIERYVNVYGQIGESVIDVVGHRVLITMPMSDDLTKCELKSIKLGPANHTTMQPDLKPGEINLSEPLQIEVTSWGRTEEWTIYTEKTELLAQTASVDAWSEVIWAYGNGPAELKGRFQYRIKGTEEWTDVDEKYISQEEGSGAFSCYIPHLQPLTTYEVRAMAGENEGNVVAATTEGTEILPDGSFDQWWLLDKKIWNPWIQNGVQFWDTGNKGAATLGESNVVPSDDTPLGTGKSAKLETRFVGILGLGKLAAGSIYTGKFDRVDGTNGILNFGRPWTLRPTKLKGYLKFHTEPINYASNEYKYLLNRPDSCHIYMIMADWTAPFEIRTNPNNRHLIDTNSPSIIAMGGLILGSDTEGWKDFVIDLEYRSTSRKPSYLLIVCAASKYGDYFTGGTGTTLYVDQFSLDYDK